MTKPETPQPLKLADQIRIKVIDHFDKHFVMPTELYLPANEYCSLRAQCFDEAYSYMISWMPDGKITCLGLTVFQNFKSNLIEVK